MSLLQKEKLFMLLHCCCAPCTSYVLEVLEPEYRISILFYNPNIEPAAEYDKRRAEMFRLLEKREEDRRVQNSLPNHPEYLPIKFIEVEYDNAAFNNAVESLRNEPEGGERCRVCFDMRLRKTAQEAKAGKYDIFATTLSVGPLKDANIINEIGSRLSEEYSVSFLPANFKTRDGFKRSVELSKSYGLYRQGYCGCNVNFELT